VRKLLGWERYDTPEAVEAINESLRPGTSLWVKPVSSSVKLLKRCALGSKVRRVMTGRERRFERVRACPQATGGSGPALDPAEEAVSDPFPVGRNHREASWNGIYRLANRRA